MSFEASSIDTRLAESQRSVREHFMGIGIIFLRQPVTKLRVFRICETAPIFEIFGVTLLESAFPTF